MSNSGGSSPFLESPGAAKSDIQSQYAKGSVHDNYAVEVAVEDREAPNFNDVDNIGSPEATASNKDDDIRILKYQLTNMKNEHEIETLRVQRKYDNIDRQYKMNMDTLEKTLQDLQKLYETNGLLEEELRNLQRKYEIETEESNLKLSTMKSDMQVKQNECEFLRSQYESVATKFENQVNENRGEQEASQALIKRFENEITKQSNQIVQLQKTIHKKDQELERVKVDGIIDNHKNYSTEEFQELTTINKLLQDQSQYVKELETANITQCNELRKLRISQETASYWKTEYEKTTNSLEDARSVLQRTEEENEKLNSQLSTWRVYLDREANADEDVNPEQILTKFRSLEKECQNYKEENAQLQKDVLQLKSLNDELALERNQSLDLHKNYEASILNLKKINHELEQQKLLSFEECKLLRQELEEINFVTENKKDPNDANLTNKKNNSTYLIQMLSDVQNKNQDLTEDLKVLNDQLLSEQVGSKKRKASDQVTLNYSKRLNELQLENIQYSKDVQKLNDVIKLLEEKIKKLVNIKEKKIRILQLRDNPLLKEQFLRKKQLDILKRENKDLLQELLRDSSEPRDDRKYVPRTVFESLNFDLKEQEHEIFKLNKKSTRLMQVFNKKSLEFIDVVTSLLGFKLEFQKDGRIKIFSCFKPNKYIIADLIANSLKSNLSTVVADWQELFHLWIEERSQIPCFLAEITLRLWEESQQSVPQTAQDS
ncbi:hypothetical protein TPHA_0J02260 [Tetrapisispora phaffii CBS 4417]|uniref:Spindle assembly checkpoint component MAD1 n=1 Tax=Tetrapisispora phaffii (strain ATCC 24235 / CBS 4417 / NBRC 1672 / NRRL Y-8282 / UCD 70-5) TaxID=1071381 RepID=G8BYV4_TETPH|nr:hypothetical protein TPHA_0J02260 [Tetrapisispora phaffii CBS 4417]CCE65046.1 hypothetical protein TPHA_0J02260 [Tetrapisispora phaffii CBS 4417]